MTTAVRPARPDDYDDIAPVVDQWWGRPVLAVLPRLFLRHFHDTSFVAHDQSGLAGFLVGFASPAEPDEAYIHFVGVRPDQRGQGLARDLYERFFAAARARGCRTVGAVTSPANTASIAYHRRLGFTVTGPVPDHHGPGQARVVFTRPL